MKSIINDIVEMSVKLDVMRYEAERHVQILKIVKAELEAIYGEDLDEAETE